MEEGRRGRENGQRDQHRPKSSHESAKAGAKKT